mmetsp:Transcript_2925/g.7868  ORF Transcript_2925/g.7868 Transcript_2925/m.7868 type:complete len:216 (+) Transcript_2925:160-807(+)
MAVVAWRMAGGSLETDTCCRVCALLLSSMHRCHLSCRMPCTVPAAVHARHTCCGAAHSWPARHVQTHASLGAAAPDCPGTLTPFRDKPAVASPRHASPLRRQAAGTALARAWRHHHHGGRPHPGRPHSAGCWAAHQGRVDRVPGGRALPDCVEEEAGTRTRGGAQRAAAAARTAAPLLHGRCARRTGAHPVCCHRRGCCCKRASSRALRRGQAAA